jgi:hypothetical protein
VSTTSHITAARPRPPDGLPKGRSSGREAVEEGLQRRRGPIVRREDRLGHGAGEVPEKVGPEALPPLIVALLQPFLTIVPGGLWESLVHRVCRQALVAPLVPSQPALRERIHDKKEEHCEQSSDPESHLEVVEEGGGGRHEVHLVVRSMETLSCGDVVAQSICHRQYYRV